jgi:poly-beta-1,6-N-acetyl-D-glucosamine synthase
MAELLQFLGAPLSPSVVGEAVANWRELLFSGNIFAWFFLIMVLRFDLPAFIVWVINLINPRAFRVPAYDEKDLPLISVIVAGRNPGAGIRKTIRSVLDSGYPRVEVLYADDYSTDDSVVHARSFEKTGVVRVFASAQHNGKPTNLNIALMMARGELSFVLDADAEVEYGTLHRLAAYFGDERIGAVAANIHVRNNSQNLLTRLQEVEYALNGSIARLWRAGLGLLPILPGAASIFRTAAIREIGGYDTGLGDDTDMTIRMLKRGWRLDFALDARIWTDQPYTIPHLIRQRVRWARNMVKVRLRKHKDFINPFKYGWNSTILAVDNIFFRLLFPLYATGAIILRLGFYGSDKAVILTSLYCLIVAFACGRILIANDLSRTPPLYDLLLAPLYPLYRLMLRTAEMIAIVRELLRIRTYHPYVPKRIWSEIPHW